MTKRAAAARTGPKEEEESMRPLPSSTFILAVTAALSVCASPAHASSFGPVYGTSGGPLGMGNSCTACHGYASGPGSTEIIGLPNAYRPGQSYDLTVRIADPTKNGAGFLFSAEANGGIVGTVIITDPEHTFLINDNQENNYVGHNYEGYLNAVANWQQNGQSAEYAFRWQAPADDIGPITFYAAGNAVDDNFSPFGDTVYLESVIVEPTVDGDGDDDGDADFADFAGLQRCFIATPAGPECTPFDLTRDDAVDLDDYDLFSQILTGPTALGPSQFRHAKPGRGAKLYDKWWAVIGVAAPTGQHPLYPPAGQATGSSTYRCKECHGWDYKGAAGVYGSGSHYTGIPGVFQTALTAQQIFNLIKLDTVPDGHGMAAYGLGDADIWDLTRFLLQFQTDSDEYISPAGEFFGDLAAGQDDFITVCSVCHGSDGTDINFGTPSDPEYVGTVANDNPWEFLHKLRGGQPGVPMPSFIDLHWSAQRAADVGAFAATLPTQ